MTVCYRTWYKVEVLEVWKLWKWPSSKLCWYVCYQKTVSKITRQIFDVLPVWLYVTFNPRVLHLWQTNFASWGVDQQPCMRLILFGIECWVIFLINWLAVNACYEQVCMRTKHWKLLARNWRGNVITFVKRNVPKDLGNTLTAVWCGQDIYNSVLHFQQTTGVWVVQPDRQWRSSSFQYWDIRPASICLILSLIKTYYMFPCKSCQEWLDKSPKLVGQTL